MCMRALVEDFENTLCWIVLRRLDSVPDIHGDFSFTLWWRKCREHDR